MELCCRLKKRGIVHELAQMHMDGCVHSFYLLLKRLMRV